MVQCVISFTQYICLSSMALCKASLRLWNPDPGLESHSCFSCFMVCMIAPADASYGCCACSLRRQDTNDCHFLLDIYYSFAHAHVPRAHSLAVLIYAPLAFSPETSSITYLPNSKTGHNMTSFFLSRNKHFFFIFLSFFDNYKVFT